MATPPVATTLKMDPEKPPFWTRLSIVWLVPLAALIGSLVVAFQAYQVQDVEIRIDFHQASGIVAGQTVIKFRDVEVGRVTRVQFSDDLSQVQVFANIHNELAPYLDADADFWAVTAEVSAQGISGLETVLGGAYIGASWDAEIGAPQRVFQALSKAPPIQISKAGSEFRLRAQKSGSVTVGAPILLRGIAVGKVQSVALTEDGGAVGISVFVEAPYDGFITTATRFWNASGVDFSLGAGGVSLNIDSIASIIQGGIVFDTLFSGGRAVSETTIFDFYKDEAAARDSIFIDGLSASAILTAEFDGSLRGLTEGASVSYKGLKVGEVIELTARVVTGEDGSETIRLLANFTIEPGRMGLRISPTEDLTLEFLNTLVEQGLRAQMATSNILTGALHIELVEAPDAPRAQIDLAAQPYPVMPSLPTASETLTAAAQGVLARVASLPIEELLDQAMTLMANINAIAADPQTQDMPTAISGILANVQRLTSSEDLQAMPGNLNAAIDELRAMLDQIETGNAIANLTAALNGARIAAGNFSEASQALPQLVSEIETLVQTANQLPLDQLAASAGSMLESADALLASDSTQALPAALERALEELRSLLSEINEGGTVDRLTEVLANVDIAAQQIGAASEGVPELLVNIDALVLKASDLPLEELAASASSLFADADALLGSDSTQALPAGLESALEELRSLLSEINESGTVDRLTEVLANANIAAQQIGTASQGLPELLENIDALVLSASELPLQELAASANDLIRSADSIVNAEGAAELPQSLRDALDQVRSVLAELQEGGAVENLNRTLTAAESAANDISVAAQSLPELVERLNRLVSLSEKTLAAYGSGSPINREAVLAIEEIRKTARAVSSLARTIERKPNSILVGR